MVYTCLQLKAHSHCLSDLQQSAYMYLPSEATIKPHPPSGAPLIATTCTTWCHSNHIHHLEHLSIHVIKIRGSQGSCPDMYSNNKILNILFTVKICIQKYIRSIFTRLWKLLYLSGAQEGNVCCHTSTTKHGQITTAWLHTHSDQDKAIVRDTAQNGNMSSALLTVTHLLT